MLRSDLSDYSNVYIIVKATINLLADAANENDKAQKDVGFKDNASFRLCISQIKNKLIDNAEDLHLVIPMFYLIGYSHNYPKPSGRLWNYYRDRIDHVDVNNSASYGKSEQTRKGLPKNGNPGDTDQPVQLPEPFLNVKVTTLLKYPSNFWRLLERFIMGKGLCIHRTSIT